ncbi:short chain dehydrogenase [Algimonas arctica]|uniref:Short chain dehydrogenase n=1 Tax=Algimonas arctica TaxID=1479486 RepID=A0A8J3G0W0_9PROT|nr:SDR family oxidoreductase [Algimonas arctica]GHA82149.1 short chain dehydrogenase [Algimonas arctica]
MKTVLITGGAARIGAFIARALAADGWKVCVHYRTSSGPADALAAEIGGVAIKANLRVPGDLAGLIESARQALGSPIHALINNASTFDPDTVEDFTNGTFDHHMDVNLRAPLTLSRDFAAQAPGQGCIINIVDQRVLRPDPSFFTYSIAKAGLYWATQTMAQAFAPDVRVNAVGPGPTLRNHTQSVDEFEREKRLTLLGNGSPPDQIVNAVRYFLGATSVTGQMIAVDGGQHLTFDDTTTEWGPDHE